MPGFLTEFSNNRVLDLFFGGDAVVSPTRLYLGLSRAPANKAGSVAEPSAGGYARVAMANDRAHFPPAIGGTKSNAAAFAFPAATACWGAVLSVFVADAAEGGNVLAMADLTSPRTIRVGAPATVAAGALSLSHA